LVDRKRPMIETVVEGKLLSADIVRWSTFIAEI